MGMQELLIILLICLLVFGAAKLPEIGKSLGKGLSEFKKASNDLKKAWEEEVELEKEKESMKGLLKDSSDALHELSADVKENK